MNQACPSCGNAYVVAKFTQAKGEFLLCPSCKQEVAAVELAASA